MCFGIGCSRTMSGSIARWSSWRTAWVESWLRRCCCGIREAFCLPRGCAGEFEGGVLDQPAGSGAGAGTLTIRVMWKWLGVHSGLQCQEGTPLPWGGEAKYFSYLVLLEILYRVLLG